MKSFSASEKLRNLVIQMIVLSILCSFNVFVAVQLQERDVRIEKEKIEAEADAQARDIYHALASRLSLTKSLEALVMQGEGKVENFEQLASIIMSYDSEDIVSLAPGGIVGKSYPKEGCLDKQGTNLYDDPELLEGIEVIKGSNRILVSEPIAQEKGGFLLAGRKPVYLTNEAGEEYLWGVVNITVPLDGLEEESRLNTLAAQGFAYRFDWLDPTDESALILLSSKEDLLTDPVEHSFEVFGQNWRISMQPIVGWSDKKSFWSNIFAGFACSLVIVLILQHMMQLKKKNCQYEELSMTDILTSLPNRRAFRRTLNDLVKRAERTPVIFAICYVDLDGFKEINDTIGHDNGDRYLIETANRFKNCLRGNDMAARIGGDEFVLLLNDIHHERDVRKVCQRIEQELERPLILDNRKYSIEVSIGYAIFPLDTTNTEQLLHIADSRMYEQKNKNKEKRKKTQADQREDTKEEGCGNNETSA